MMEIETKTLSTPMTFLINKNHGLTESYVNMMDADVLVSSKPPLWFNLSKVIITECYITLSIFETR